MEKRISVGERSKMGETGVVLAVGAAAPLNGLDKNGRSRGGIGRREPTVSQELEKRPRTSENHPFLSEMKRVAEQVKKRGGYDILEVACSQFAGPSVAEAIEKVIAQGARRVIVVPTWLTGGRTDVESDIPKTVTVVRQRHPEVEIVYTGPDLDPVKRVDLIISKIRDYEKAYVPSGSESGVMWLSALQAGQTAVIHDFVAGHTLVSRLSVLGFTPDARVTMVQNFGHGPVIVNIRDTRVALGRGEAARVRVRRLADDQ
jgi:ferrous iron transport protein A